MMGEDKKWQKKLYNNNCLIFMVHCLYEKTCFKNMENSHYFSSQQKKEKKIN